MENNQYDIAIIGGGIVGAACMYQIQKHHPGLKLILIEKEEAIASHQTGHNSGVIHSGLYYKPGSLKANCCVKGRRELVEFSKEHKVPHDVCGKVVVATELTEIPYLEKIYKNGQENQIEGIAKINADQIREIEPECTGVAGIHVPCTGIIDFKIAAEKMVEVACGLQQESKVSLGEEVLYIKNEGENNSLIRTMKSRYLAKNLLFCAGLQADRLAQKDGLNFDERIVGFRGDYYDLSPEAEHKVKNLIYPVPNPAFPFLGVHFTRMIQGGVECGPNAVFTFKREGYNKFSFDSKDTAAALSFVGTWKLFGKHWRYGINEYRRAFSKRMFLQTLQRLVPSLQMEDIVVGRSGVRAMLLDREGEMVDDFKIVRKDNHIHVLNAPSPAATSSLAIGDHIRKEVEQHLTA